MNQIQQFNVASLTCNKVEHQGEKIKALCLNPGCDKTSSLCFKCVQELHQGCHGSIKMCKDIPELVSPLELMKVKLIELKLNANLLISKLTKSIEEALKPISEYTENPNLTNLNKLGTFLKQQTESNMKKQFEKAEKDIIQLFEQYRSKLFKNQPIEINHEALETKIKQLLNERKAEDALTVVETAIQSNSNSNNKTLLFNKGQILYQLKRYQAAIDCFDVTIKIDRYNSLAWQNKGQSLWQLDRNEEAVNCFYQAMKIDPNNGWDDKRQQLFDQKRFQESLIYSNQVNKYPNYIQAWNNKGYSLNQLKKYQEALNYLDQGIKMNPKNVNCYKNKGYSLIGLKRYQEAIEQFQYALKLKPNHANAMFGLNIAMEELKKLKK